jgi:hypothetical protein
MVFLVPLSSATDGERINATLIRPIISENITEQSYDFDFSGDHILWRNVYDQSRTDGLYGGLYLYSLKDNSTRPIATETASGGKGIYWQTMSDNTVVWYENPGILHLYNISSHEERIIPDIKTKGAQKIYSWNGERDIERWGPFIDGDRVIWLQGFPAGTYANADIFLLNLTTNKEIPVNESPSAKGGLAMSGDRIVWYSHSEKRDGRETDIYLHDLATGADTVVCSDPGLQMQTALSEKYIAWTDSHDPLSVPLPLSQIHIYTISDRTTQTIPTTTMNQYNPFFAEDYVIYTECTPYEKSVNKRTCESKIFDIRTGTILNHPSSGNSRDENPAYTWKIHDYSRGVFLVEEIQNGERSFGLYRIDNLRPENTPTIFSGTESGLSGNAPATVRPAGTELTTQPSFGFDGLLAVLTFLIMGIIAQNGGRKHKD